MKLLIASAILAVCAGAPIESLYIPSVLQPDLFDLGGYRAPPALRDLGGYRAPPALHEPQEQQAHNTHRANDEADKTASIVKYDSESHGDSYHYDFETSNGIRAEQSGAAGKGSLAQGGFSYTGDDGKQYTVTYTADEHGFRPQGDHLPTPPPAPEAILRALEQNAKDEAAGISDDGSYVDDKNEEHGSSELQLGHGSSIHGPIIQSPSIRGHISSGYVY